MSAQEFVLLSENILCTTQVNTAFQALSLVNSEVIIKVLFTSKQAKRNFQPFDVLLSKIRYYFGPLVFQLLW